MKFYMLRAGKGMEKQGKAGQGMIGIKDVNIGCLEARVI